jgi:hypothetical protein
MALQISVNFIEPDEDTCYLVGPEGLVWTQPSIGEPFLAARNEQERKTAELFVGELLEQGLVPYGIPLQQRVTRAVFGGAPIRDCRWVKHTDAPAPTGEDDEDELPKRAAVIQ